LAARQKLDHFDAQNACGGRLVSIPRLDDRLGLLAAVEEFEGLVG
jgi:hypothetical protein